MATYYVSSVDGNDADSGLTWALAKATLAGALAVATSSGDVIYLDSAHSENPAANISLQFGVTGIALVILSVDRAGSVTTGHSGHLKGAKIKPQSGFSLNVFTSSTFIGRAFVKGVTFETTIASSSSNDLSILTSATDADSHIIYFDDCEFNSLSASTGAFLTIGPGTSTTFIAPTATFKNCLFTINNHSSAIGIRVQNIRCEWINCSIAYAGASKPTVLFQSTGGASSPRAGWFRLFNCDLSGFNTTSGSYFSVVSYDAWDVLLQNCKLSSVPALISGSFPTGSSASITLVNTDSGDTKTVFEYRNRYGTITESTSIYADASEQMNGTSLSWEIVTTAEASEFTPFVAPFFESWNDSTASQTLNFKLIHDSATNLHDRNCWAELEYVSDASFPKGTMSSSRNAQPFDGSAADLTADTETWTGTGGFVLANKQKIAFTFTAAEKSLLRARLNVGVASKTLYLVPHLMS